MNFSRKGRDKGNLLEPLDTDIYSNFNQDGTRRFSKSSDTKANKIAQPKRNQSFSPSPYKKVTFGDMSFHIQIFTGISFGVE